MAKVRFSISLDETAALAIKRAAERANLDISTYMSRAALAAVRRDARAAEVFGDVDAGSAADGSGAGAAEAGSVSAAPAQDVDRSAVEERWRRFFTPGAPGARGAA